MPVDGHHAFAGGRVYPRPPFARLGGGSAAWRSFERGSLLGADCRLGANARCANDGPRERVRLGRGVACRGIVRRETFGDGLIEIGDLVYIGDDCIISCSEHVTIGAGTLLGHGVQIFDNNSHPVERDERARDWRAVLEGGTRSPIQSAPVSIGAHAWIGFGSIVLKGVTIGNAAVVGAGSVVTRDVDPGATVAGNPAQRI
jgi:acetyltransferase-like isoleucine patch superfamily enzyme